MQLLVWDTSERSITNCIKVAGEITSLNTCENIVAVGSSEAQLFHLRKNMQRTLLCREDDPIKVFVIKLLARIIL